MYRRDGTVWLQLWRDIVLPRLSDPIGNTKLWQYCATLWDDIANAAIRDPTHQPRRASWRHTQATSKQQHQCIRKNKSSETRWSKQARYLLGGLCFCWHIECTFLFLFVAARCVVFEADRQGFRHFDTYLRGREELLMRVTLNPPAAQETRRGSLTASNGKMYGSLGGLARSASDNMLARSA